MIKRKLLVSLATLALSTLVFGQAESAPTRADVTKLVELLQVRARVVQMMGGVAEQARLGAEEGFKQQVPNATPAQLARVDAISDTVFKSMPIDEMVDAMIPIYQKHLTKSDVDGIIAFYSSPVGQRFLKVQPAMMTEAMAAGGKIGRERIASLTEVLNRQITAFAEEEKKQESKDKPQTPPN